ncbi:hypothetical protein NDU88_007286 [Pleurodeles waltl]|uniref:Uncharacterized protein n=1 Tax=Pleurodeles waltl TaxID=8319 RepID=A0AAV7LT63_PLEWA|nr:hypothetical protein NDU88_007286 [Pleurodeles waltl]
MKACSSVLIAGPLHIKSLCIRVPIDSNHHSQTPLQLSQGEPAPPVFCWDESSSRLRSPLSRKVPSRHTLIMLGEWTSADTLSGGGLRFKRGQGPMDKSLVRRGRLRSGSCGIKSSHSPASERL